MAASIQPFTAKGNESTYVSQDESNLFSTKDERNLISLQIQFFWDRMENVLFLITDEVKREVFSKQLHMLLLEPSFKKVFDKLIIMLHVMAKDKVQLFIRDLADIGNNWTLMQNIKENDLRHFQNYKYKILESFSNLSPRSLASFISRSSLIDNIGQYFESFNSDIKVIVGRYKNDVEYSMFTGRLMNLLSAKDWQRLMIELVSFSPKHAGPKDIKTLINIVDNMGIIKHSIHYVKFIKFRFFETLLCAIRQVNRNLRNDASRRPIFYFFDAVLETVAQIKDLGQISIFLQPIKSLCFNKCFVNGLSFLAEMKASEEMKRALVEYGTKHREYSKNSIAQIFAIWCGSELDLEPKDSVFEDYVVNVIEDVSEELI